MAANDMSEDLLAEEGINFHEIWEQLRKQYKLILFIAGAVLLTALVRVQMQTPLYKARGTLLIDKEGRGQMNLLNQWYGYDSDWKDEYLNTQIRVLTSRSLARKVIGELCDLQKIATGG